VLKLGDVAAKLTWPLLLKNSYASELEPSAPAALRFQQLDGMRAQRTSDVLIAAGQRVAAALAFDDLAQKYKKKPAAGMLDQLKVKCAEVAAGDDKQIAAVKSLVSVLEESQKLVAAEKAKDPQWGQVEAALAQQLTSSTGEVVRVEEQKKNDLNACPKVKF
jgi:D-alanyl-D-alanine carboxypeptidase